MMSFPPVQCLICYFIMNLFIMTVFHSSFLLQHNHDSVSVLPFIPTFALVCANSLGTEEKVTERF